MISKILYFTCDVEIRENVSFKINLKKTISKKSSFKFLYEQKTNTHNCFNTDFTIFIANNASTTQVLWA